MQNIRNKSNVASILAAVSLFIFAASFPAAAQSSQTFVLKKSAMAGGGGKGSSPNMSLASGVGQAAPQGKASSSSFRVDPGFFKPNKAPVAAAGSDMVVECSSPARTAVTLDGSASTDPDMDTLHFAWTGAFGGVSGVSPAVALPLGSANISLVVSDDQVNSAPDSVQVRVTVRPEGFESPLASLVIDGQPAPLPAKAFRQGRTLPLKLRLLCGATPVTDQDGVRPPEIVALLRMGEALNLDTIDLATGEANDSGLAFRFSTDGSWIYNLSTKNLAAGAYVVSIKLPDGRKFNGAFDLK